MPEFGLGVALVEGVNIKSQLVSMLPNAKESASPSVTSDPMVGPDFHQALNQAGIASARPANRSNKSNEVVQSGVENKVSIRGLTGVQDSSSHLSGSGKSALAAVTVHAAAKLVKSDKNAASSMGKSAIRNLDALATRTTPAASLTPDVSLSISTGACLTPDAQASLTIQGAYGVGSLDQSGVAAVGVSDATGQQLNVPALNTPLVGSEVAGQKRVSSALDLEGSPDATSSIQIDSEAGSCDSSQSTGTLNSSSAESFVAVVGSEMGLLPSLNPPVPSSGSGLVSISASGKIATPKKMDADTSEKAGDNAVSALSNLEVKDPLKTVNEATPAVSFAGSQIKDEAAPVASASSAHLPAPSAPSIKDHMAAVEVQATPLAADARSSSASTVADAILTATPRLSGLSLSSSSGNLTFSSVNSVAASSANIAMKTSGLGSTTGSQKGKPASDLRSGTNSQAAPADNSLASLSNGSSQVAGSGSDSQTSADANSTHANAASDAAFNQQNTMPMPPSVQAAPVEVSSPTQPSVQNTDGSSSLASPVQTPVDNGPLSAQAIPSVNNAQLIQSMHHSEMRLGMHSTEFGNLSISTSLNHQALSAQISTDHAELGRALAMHLPAMQEKLGNAYGMQARVEVRDGGSSSSYSNAGQQSKENRQGQPQGLAGSTMTSLDSTSVSTNSTTASMYADSSRLDIQV